MSRINIKKLAPNVAKINSCSTTLVEKIFDTLISEIEFELLNNNRISLPGIITLGKAPMKMKKAYSRQLGCMVKVKYDFKLDTYISHGIKEKLNFKG